MSPSVIAFAVVLLGATLGSFLNALLFRFGTGRGIIWASSTSLRPSRSRCMRCNHALGAADLVPIVSYLLLRGRCRHCSARVSFQYPLVEAAAALLALLTWYAHPFDGLRASPEPAAFAFWLLVWLTALFIVVYDLRHQIIPWSASLLLLGLALLHVLREAKLHAFFSSDIWAGPLLAAPLLLLFAASQGRWMGFGDVPLALAVGWLLGLSGGFSALVLGCCAGALVGIGLIASQKGVTLKSEVPFAPFLLFGAFLVHFFYVDLFATIPPLFY